MIDELSSGNDEFGGLGLSSFRTTYVAERTPQPPPSTAVPTLDPNFGGTVEDDESISPIAITFISLAVLALIVGIVVVDSAARSDSSMVLGTLDGFQATQS